MRHCNVAKGHNVASQVRKGLSHIAQRILQAHCRDIKYCVYFRQGADEQTSHVHSCLLVSNTCGDSVLIISPNHVGG